MGKEFVFISNIDNLGATVDLGITLVIYIDYIVSCPADFLWLQLARH